MYTKNKIKIGIISEPLNGNLTGVGYYTYHIIKSLIENDKKNQYFLINWKKTSLSPLVPSIIVKNPFKKILATYGWYLTLPFQLRNHKLDFIFNPSSVPTFFKFKQKYIITIHDLSPIIFTKTHKFGKNLIYRYLLPKTLKEAYGIIADSNNTKEDIIKYFGLPAGKIKVVYPGVDKKYKLIDKKIILEKIKNRYKLPNKFILNVGTLEPRKNIESLLRVFSKIKKNLNYYLVIVGIKGWKYKKIFSLINKLKIKNKVIFTGYIKETDLPAIYNLASLFVYPSLYEGFGLPPLEAMACGCPTVISNVSSLPEVCGEAAYYINPYTINSISKGIEKALGDKNLRKKMIEDGLKQAKKFNWGKTSREILKIYEQLG